nr:THAP domain-containing protein 5 isoform X2 [Jaculus jaculus]
MCLKSKSEESFLSNEAKKNIVNIQILPQHAELLDSPAMVKPPAAKLGMMQNNMLTPNLVKQDTENPESTLEASIHQDVGVSGFFTSSANLNSTTITLTTSNSEGIITSHLTNPNFINNSAEIMSAQENSFFFSPAEELNTNNESVIAIFVPTENSKPSVNLFIPAPKVTMTMEDTDTEDSFCKDVDRDAEVLQIEHSYCRQDMKREHLWQKVSKLHSKVTLLELQEQQTLGRLRSLEALVSQLKQENWISEETVKIIENHFTTYEVTMI